MALKYTDGTPRFANEAEFENVIVGMSLAQVIDFVTNPTEKKPANPAAAEPVKTKPEEKKKEENAPAGQENGPKKKQGTLVNLDF